MFTSARHSQKLIIHKIVFFFFFSRRNSSSTGPFVVPDHLRQDVEEFEALYEQHSHEYVVRNKKLWDINPKQKCSSLYEWVA